NVNDHLWWINFSLKWQLVQLFSVAFAAKRNTAGITSEYLMSHHISFFDTDEFQLWSMNNADKKIKNTWKSYKYTCKDVIYEFTRDKAYRDNKVKRGSRLRLLRYQ